MTAGSTYYIHLSMNQEEKIVSLGSAHRVAILAIEVVYNSWQGSAQPFKLSWGSPLYEALLHCLRIFCLNVDCLEAWDVSEVNANCQSRLLPNSQTREFK